MQPTNASINNTRGFQTVNYSAPASIGNKKLEIVDIIDYSNQTSTTSRAIINIKLFLSGKGVITKNTLVEMAKDPKVKDGLNQSEFEVIKKAAGINDTQPSKIPYSSSSNTSRIMNRQFSLSQTKTSNPTSSKSLDSISDKLDSILASIKQQINSLKQKLSRSPKLTEIDKLFADPNSSQLLFRGTPEEAKAKLMTDHQNGAFLIHRSQTNKNHLTVSRFVINNSQPKVVNFEYERLKDGRFIQTKGGSESTLKELYNKLETSKDMAVSTKELNQGHWNNPKADIDRPTTQVKQSVVVDSAESDSAFQAWNKLEKQTEDKMGSYEYQNKLYTSYETGGRFNNIHPVKSTIVTVNDTPIHANFVGSHITERKFIAAQAPTQEHIPLFWNAMLDHSSTIFDLTNENDKSPSKGRGAVISYYPEEVGQSQTYDNIEVKLTKKDTGAQATTYTYEIKDMNTQKTKTITRINYDQWPDHGAVNTKELHQLTKLVENTQSLDETLESNLCVHCRAGVGRTGALITALILRDKIDSGEIKLENLNEQLTDLIFNLRQQRGAKFVQDPVQFELLLNYGNALLTNPSSLE